MIPFAWQAGRWKLAVSQAPSKRWRCQIAAVLTVKGRVLIMLIPAWSLCLHTREVHILPLQTGYIAYRAVIMSLYFSHSFLLCFGSPLHPWLNIRVMGTSERYFPSSCSGLCASHDPFPSGFWGSLRGFRGSLSVEKLWNLRFSYKLSKDRGRHEELSGATILSFHPHLTTEAAAVVSVSWLQTYLCCPFFSSGFFLFPNDAPKSIAFLALCKGSKVVLKESKLIACELRKITCSSHHFEPGRLLSICCPSKHLWRGTGPWEMLWCSLQWSSSIDEQLTEGSVLLLLIYWAVAKCCWWAQSWL